MLKEVGNDRQNQRFLDFGFEPFDLGDQSGHQYHSLIEEEKRRKLCLSEGMARNDAEDPLKVSSLVAGNVSGVIARVEAV